jgi:hypothetical protein
MDPLNSISKRILRFSGVQPQVLKQLETDRLKTDAQMLFGKELDVFIKSDDKTNSSIVEFGAEPEAKVPEYASGFFRNLHRAITGLDIQPTEVMPKVKSEQTGDFFERTVRSDN